MLIPRPASGLLMSPLSRLISILALTLALTLGVALLGSCANTGAESDKYLAEQLPAPESESLAAALPEEGEASEEVAEETTSPGEGLPPLDEVREDRSQISGWKVKDVTEQLPTDKDLTPSMVDPSLQGQLRQSTETGASSLPPLVQQQR